MRIRWDRSKGRPEPIRALNRIPELDNGEPLVSILERCPRVQVPRPQTIPWVRESVAQMLHRASISLPDGLFIAVTDAWRPFRRQELIYDFMWKSGQEAFPHLSYAQLRRKINRWVAPTDQKAPPGHCTGAAVDILLVDATGEPIDITSPFERFAAAPTWATNLSEEAYRNRMIMVEAMLEVGFSNCRDEYWHYSYGDAGWAVREAKSECFYGLIELPLEQYAEAQKLWEEAFRDRENPFLAPALKQ